jgi:hypothetical protein
MPPRSKTRHPKVRKIVTREEEAAEIPADEVEAWFAEEEQEASEELSAPAGPDAVASKYARSQLRVVRETKDFTLDYLQHALRRSNYIVNVAPEYQRRQRWSNKKRSLLVESFLMNIPIPPVFLFEREYNAYEVIDGRQRLDTIRDFLDNSFALTGLQYWGELNGKRFKKLPQVIQNGLIRRSIGAVILLAETRRPEHDDFDVRTVLFDRLNTGGEKLNPQELRNALYPGPFNKLLIRLARSDEFTSVWGIPPRSENEDNDVPDELAKNTLYRTMADCELVLRFFAIREALTEDRKGSLRRLLDLSMRRHTAADTDASLSVLQDEFLSSLVALTELFDGKPFRLPSTTRLSRPLFDALMVAYSLVDEQRQLRPKNRVHADIAKALQDEDKYDVLVGRGNTLDSIRKRVALASSILFGRRPHG